MRSSQTSIQSHVASVKRVGRDDVTTTSSSFESGSVSAEHVMPPVGEQVHNKIKNKKMFLFCMFSGRVGLPHVQT